MACNNNDSPFSIALPTFPSYLIVIQTSSSFNPNFELIISLTTPLTPTPTIAPTFSYYIPISIDTAWVLPVTIVFSCLIILQFVIVTPLLFHFLIERPSYIEIKMLSGKEDCYNCCFNRSLNLRIQKICILSWSLILAIWYSAWGSYWTAPFTYFFTFLFVFLTYNYYIFFRKDTLSSNGMDDHTQSKYIPEKFIFRYEQQFEVVFVAFALLFSILAVVSFTQAFNYFQIIDRNITDENLVLQLRTFAIFAIIAGVFQILLALMSLELTKATYQVGFQIREAEKQKREANESFQMNHVDFNPQIEEIAKI